MIDAHVGADSSPESAGEMHSTVGDDIVSYAMLVDHFLEIHTCQLCSVDILSEGYGK